ncbi:MAG: hypothetical protein JWN39_3178, partial [Ilumatobacteraceae bacterium]|nr:hypothetical protein [Ilumatobacteraceae bacterium]
VAAFDPLTSQPSGFAPARFVGRPAALETSCSSVTKAIFDGVDEVFAKLQIPHGKVGDTGSSFLNGLLQGLTDIVVAGLNFFVNAAKALVVEGIEYVLDKVLGFVATVAAAAALVSEFVSAVRPWTVKTTVDPAQITKGVDPVYVTATATLSVAAADDEDWPGWFKNCAMAAGVTLPSLLPVGAPVEWKVETRPPDTELLTESSAVFEKNTTLIKQGSQVVAKDGLEAATETQEQVDTGDAMEGAVVVTATVSRRQVRELRDTLIDLAKSLARQVLEPVPAIIRDYLLKLVDEAATSAIGDVAALLDVSSAIAVGVTWPKPKPRPTTIPPTSSPSAASQYCALFIAFANWSLTNLSAITAESSTDSWAARDPYFAEYLVRMAAMQQVAPAQLVDALATLVHFATLYSAHDVAGAAADASAVASAGTTINAYGRTVCGYDPAVSVSG